MAASRQKRPFAHRKCPFRNELILREPVAPGLAQADLLDRARVGPLREQAGDLPRVAKCRDSSA